MRKQRGTFSRGDRDIFENFYLGGEAIGRIFLLLAGERIDVFFRVRLSETDFPGEASGWGGNFWA